MIDYRVEGGGSAWHATSRQRMKQAETVLHTARLVLVKMRREGDADRLARLGRRYDDLCERARGMVAGALADLGIRQRR